MRTDAAVAGLAGIAAWVSRDMSVAYVGVPLNVVVACVAGAYSSFSFGDKVEPRGAMFRLFTACVILGCALTALVQAGIGHWMGQTLKDGAQAGMGAIISCLTRFWVPSVIGFIKDGTWVDWIPFLRRNRESK
jgi:hypothetical protein